MYFDYWTIHMWGILFSAVLVYTRLCHEVALDGSARTRINAYKLGERPKYFKAVLSIALWVCLFSWLYFVYYVFSVYLASVEAHRNVLLLPDEVKKNIMVLGELDLNKDEVEAVRKNTQQLALDRLKEIHPPARVYRGSL